MSLEKFLGLFTGASPESLPEGGSPLCFNDDFIVSGVFARPGLKSVYTLNNDSVENLAGLGQSLSGPLDPNEQPWSSPNNLTGDAPGSYAEALLNAPSGGGASGTFDKSSTNSGTGTTASVSGTPSRPGEAALLLTSGGPTQVAGAPSPSAGWSLIDNPEGVSSSIYGAVLPTAAPVSETQGMSTSQGWASILAFFGSATGVTPVKVQFKSLQNGSLPAGTYSSNFTFPVTAGNGILVIMAYQVAGLTVPSGFSASDNQAGTYTLIGQANSGANGSLGGIAALWRPNAGGANAPSLTFSAGSAAGCEIRAYEISGIGALAATPGISQLLQATQFNFNIPSNANILGIEIETFGHQTTQPPDAQIKTNLIVPGGAVSPTSEQAQLPLSDGEIITGSATELWGLTLTPAIVNSPTFGAQIVASAATLQTFDIYAVKIKIFTSAPPSVDFNYVKTYEQTSGQVNTLALDSNGTIWKEDVNNDEGVLNSVYSAVEPGSFAQSTTIDDTEFIAFSDLQNASDIPRAYNGSEFNRISQVGPGAPPTASVTSSGSAIQSITQNPPVPLLVGPHDWLLVSDSPSDHGSFGTPATPGNIMSLYFRSATVVPSYLKPGVSIVISGFPAINGHIVNNDPAGVLAPKFYTVISVGQAIPGQQSFVGVTFTVNFTTFYNQETPNGCVIQATEATLTTVAQVDNLEVGSQVNIAGTGGAPPAGYDGTFLIDETPNASQLQIVSTQLSSNVATYGYNLITGTTPIAGQTVTVANTLNGNGIFNVSRAVILSVTAGTFSLSLLGPNIPSAAEAGAGLIFGTIFKFDPFTIVGTRIGGTILTVGILAAGIRKICYSFLTDSGYMTQPSPIFTLDVPQGASALTVGNILTGPPNVVARVVHITPANGENFYDILVPVTVLSNGQNVVNTATVLNDNSSTNINLSFADEVLTAEPGIDVPGNNLFETRELGAPVAFIAYAERLFAIGEQNKIQNLLNYSFDGGIQVNPGNIGAGGGAGTAQTYPAGWTVDPAAGGGGSVVNSPIFGSAYQITGTGTVGFPSGNVGMITQPAFQDEFEVPIVLPSTTYSVRLAAMATAAGADTNGKLVIDFFSPGLGAAVGTFTLPLSQLATSMKVFSGTLLTTVLAPVPKDLLVRIYLTGLETTWTVTIDRMEPYPTELPNLSGQIIGSYQANFEAFDRLDGVIGASVQNQQPVKSAFTLFDTLYMVKTNSLVSTQDNKTTQPSQWSTPRVISNVVGTTSIFGVAGISDDDSGEEWAVIAGQPGVYVFNGGEPIKIIEEIQELWDLINWKYGHTLWVTNDIKSRRILIGVPMRTFTVENGVNVQNPWIPQGLIPDDGNPTTPNIVLALNYRFLTTAASLAERPEIHVSSFGGKLLSVDMSRKWNIWTIKSPCAAFIKRSDTTTQTFFGNSSNTGKLYQLTPGLLEDDGVAFWQLWTSHGFPVPEQEQGLQLGSVRKMFEYMTMVLDGTGSLTIKVFPDKLTTPYARVLTPNLTLPASSGPDVEIPVNEVGARLFIQFSCNAVGAGFQLSRIVLPLRQDPWSPVTGRNI